jgi:hypothetical protein
MEKVTDGYDHHGIAWFKRRTPKKTKRGGTMEADGAYSRLSRTLAELGASRPFDFPLPLSEFRAYAQECLASRR